MINPSLGCLVASVSVASSPVTSDEIETISIEIVENSLELFNTILTTIRQSTRAGGHVLQNYIMMGAWVLTSGLLGTIHIIRKHFYLDEHHEPKLFEIQI